MVTEGVFYLVFRKPSLATESKIANGDLTALINAQMIQDKLNNTISGYCTNFGAQTLDVGGFKVLTVPLGFLGNVKNMQENLPVSIAMGIGSTIDGAYLALQLAQKNNKPLELYVKGKTEKELGLAKSEGQEPDLVQPPEYHENVEQALDAQIRAAGHQIDPDAFAGLVQDFQMILQNFKITLPSIETMQVTNPTAYSAILDVVQASSSLAQMLLESGILNSDAAMMVQHQAEQEDQQNQDEQPEEDKGDIGGSPNDENKAKASKNLPVGTVKRYSSGWRIKTSDGSWKYVNHGVARGADGGIGPGASAGAEGKHGSKPDK